MMALPYRLKNVVASCRTCLSESSSEMISILQSGTSVGIADILTSCTGIQVHENDQLPQHICRKCHQILIDFNEFRKVAETIDSVLRREMSYSNNSGKQSESVIKVEVEVASNYDFNNFNIADDNNFSDYSDEEDNNRTFLKKEQNVKSFKNIKVEETKPVGFACDICKKNFKTLAKLNQHTKRHFKTNIGDKLNLTKKNIESDIVSPEKKAEANIVLELECKQSDLPLKCEICRQKFSTVLKFEKHKKRHLKKKDGSSFNLNNIVNNRDEVKITEEDSLNMDIESENNDAKSKYVKAESDLDNINFESDPKIIEIKLENISSDLGSRCDICRQKFDTAIKLERHKNRHFAKKFSCGFCDITFRDKSKLLKHMSEHDANLESNQIYQCSVCSERFASIFALSGHMKAHKKEERILTCPICSKAFTKESHLKRHEFIHKRPFKCDKCDHSFNFEHSLLEHQNKHKGLKPNVCPICSKAFALSSSLTIHLKIHTGEKSYLCPICGKNFDSKSNLDQHSRRHFGVKPFKCQLCPSRFTTKGELKSHSLTHSGLKAFTCDQCGASFSKGHSLTTHKLRHLGVKPHQCDVCPMRFLSKDHLKRHYRIHTGEKPYKCELCERAFTQSNDLVKHRRMHLGDSLYKCDKCSKSFRLKTELRHHITEHYTRNMTTEPTAQLVSNPVR